MGLQILTGLMHLKFEGVSDLSRKDCRRLAMACGQKIPNLGILWWPPYNLNPRSYYCYFQNAQHPLC